MNARLRFFVGEIRMVQKQENVLPRTRHWLKFVILCVVGFVVVLAGCVALTAHVVDKMRYTYENPLLVGVWVGEPGNVFELDADGTGRGRANHTTKILFLRWNERDGILSVYFEPREKSLAWKTEQLLRGLPKCAQSHYRIGSVDERALVLHGLIDDKPFTFTRSTDEAFDRQDVPNSVDLRTDSANEGERQPESDLGGRSSSSAG